VTRPRAAPLLALALCLLHTQWGAQGRSPRYEKELAQ
jgi:hypothetical protein